jgi:hypothetical protein
MHENVDSLARLSSTQVVVSGRLQDYYSLSELFFTL